MHLAPRLTAVLGHGRRILELPWNETRAVGTIRCLPDCLREDPPATYVNRVPLPPAGRWPEPAGGVSPTTMEPHSVDVEQRGDGAVLVRMHSRDSRGQPLPDAVFTFRRGDPQYEYWDAKCREQHAAERQPR